MKDILGRDLFVGTVCAFNPPRYKGIVLCKVVKINPKKVTVTYDGGETTSVYPFDLAILDEQDVVLHYLKKKG